MNKTVIRETIEIIRCPHCKGEISLKPERRKYKKRSKQEQKKPKLKRRFVGKRKWTDEEDNTIRNTELTKEIIPRLAITLDRTEKSIRCRIQGLGLSIRKRNNEKENPLKKMFLR